ncbi:hypothetical protein HYW17_02840 [Candidatus Uhrbacteria bacterium]|nr:hypothetical protein [Candidatus Uhrbacteria bacterium]
MFIFIVLASIASIPQMAKADGRDWAVLAAGVIEQARIAGNRARQLDARERRIRNPADRDSYMWGWTELRDVRECDPEPFRDHRGGFDYISCVFNVVEHRWANNGSWILVRWRKEPGCREVLVSAEERVVQCVGEWRYPYLGATRRRCYGGWRTDFTPAERKRVCSEGEPLRKEFGIDRESLMADPRTRRMVLEMELGWVEEDIAFIQMKLEQLERGRQDRCRGAQKSAPEWEEWCREAVSDKKFFRKDAAKSLRRATALRKQLRR